MLKKYYKLIENKNLCLICNRQYSLNTQIKFHIEAHLKTKSYNCLICNKVFISSKQIYSHNNMHIITKCHLCQKEVSANNKSKHKLRCKPIAEKSK